MKRETRALLAILAAAMVYVGSYLGHRIQNAETVTLPLPFDAGVTRSTHLEYGSSVPSYVFWPLWRLDEFVTGLNVDRRGAKTGVEPLPY
ncbi:MAG: hypothetical protein E4G93_03325 [Dehalococcoidia bacterium]|nr:MAG: hypothetical protein E4G93_03325 [Dehalococcoidia bacterium]